MSYFSHYFDHLLIIRTQIEARKDALRRNPEYKKYIQNLVSSGYFKGEIEGSQLWNSLEDKAAEVFVEARREECVAFFNDSFIALILVY